MDNDSSFADLDGTTILMFVAIAVVVMMVLHRAICIEHSEERMWERIGDDEWDDSDQHHHVKSVTEKIVEVEALTLLREEEQILSGATHLDQFGVQRFEI